MSASRRIPGTIALTAAVAIAGCRGVPRPAPEPVSHAAPAPAVAPAAAPDLPTVPPAALPVEPVRFPPFQERTLANGARVIVVPDHEQPIVSVSLRIRDGSAADPAGKPGVASLTAALLTRGTAGRSAAEVAEAIDFVGGELSASASEDWTSTTITVLTDFLDTGLELLADVATRPTFPGVELAIERKRTLATLQGELGDPATLAMRRFLREIYGEHPYGKSLTPASVRAIARRDLLAFHAKYYHPSNALFVVAGDVDPDTVFARLGRAFAGWRGGTAPAGHPPEPPAQARRRLVFVHQPGTVQAVYRIGNLMPPAQNDDWVAISVMNQILGEDASGWLFEVLREQSGYTYGAYSSATERRGRGYFQARADVRNAVADSALAKLLQQLDRIRAAPVSDADLAAAKSYLSGSFPLSVEIPQQVANQLATTLLLGRPATYLETFRVGVQATTAGDVQRVAREYLHPERAVIVVVGDAGRILEKLRPFADVIEVYDARGRAVAPGTLSGASR